MAVPLLGSQEQMHRHADGHYSRRTPENGRKVIAHRFTGGTGGSEVWLYEIVGGKHSWGEQDIDTGEELWKFFSKFVK